MDPIGPRSRRTAMRPLALSFAALALPLALAACGSDGDSDDAASDPAPTTATSSPTPTPTPTPSPSAEPTVGTYPSFGPTDYGYQLTISCFCVGAGVPIEVTVVDAEVVGAVYAVDDSGRSGVKAGDPADTSSWLTINDIIDKANDTAAARVDVEWPAGQDYPNSVYVDGDEMVADDETGYTVSDVTRSTAG